MNNRTIVITTAVAAACGAAVLVSLKRTAQPSEARQDLRLQEEVDQGAPVAPRASPVKPRGYEPAESSDTPPSPEVVQPELPGGGPAEPVEPAPPPPARASERSPQAQPPAVKSKRASRSAAPAAGGPEPVVPAPLARSALSYVGADPAAEHVWFAAINDPDLPANTRKDLIEDLNEDGFPDPKHLTPDDLPLIVSRLQLIEQLAPDAMDDVNFDAFAEAYKDLINMYAKVTRR